MIGKKDPRTFYEEKILECARQWARCVLFKGYVEDGKMTMCGGSDSEMMAEHFMRSLQFEAKLMMMERGAQKKGEEYLP